MAYSGTIGQTVINVQKLIDHGARRAGKLAEELTSEQVQAARESLYFWLSSLANLGIQYWAINKKVLGTDVDDNLYYLPVGTIDTLNVLYRTSNRPSGTYASSAGGVAANAGDSDLDTYCQQTSTNGNISINFGASNAIFIGTIGFMPYIASNGSGVWSYVLECSADNITWSTLATGTNVAVQDKVWVWTDISAGQTVPYYRMRATDGTTLSLRELYFGNNTKVIPMARLNRDDYTNLPNQMFTANQPYQFWLNRTIPQPSLNVWPVPDDPFVQIVVYYSRQIMDVGALTDQLEIPQRWYEATVNSLAYKMSMELPNVDLARIQYLQGISAATLMEAEQEERDKSPIYFAPNISVYTK
jgi:hypothetical protein